MRLSIGRLLWTISVVSTALVTTESSSPETGAVPSLLIPARRLFGRSIRSLFPSPTSPLFSWTTLPSFVMEPSMVKLNNILVWDRTVVPLRFSVPVTLSSHEELTLSFNRLEKSDKDLRWNEPFDVLEEISRYRKVFHLTTPSVLSLFVRVDHFLPRL